MLPIDPSHDYAHCGGPCRCSYCAEILSETPERGYQRRAAEDRARGLRTAAQHDYTPPDPWAAGIARLQADAQAAAARTYQPTPRSTEIHLDEHGIPDPYCHAIQARLREENKR